MIRENQYFWLQSGHPIRSLKELNDLLPTLSSEEFNFHVNHSKNDFAVWVRDVFDHDLAQLLAQAQSQEEMVEVMNEEFENEEEEDEPTAQKNTQNNQNNAEDAPSKTEPEKKVEEKSPKQTTGKISDSLPQTFEEISEKKESGPDDGQEYSGEQGTSYREKIADRFAEAHKKMLDSLKHVVPETLQEKYDLLEEKEKDLRMEISEQRKAGYDLYIADITLQRFRSLLDMAKATEDTNDIKVIEKLFEEVQKEIDYAKENPGPNVKKEIEALVSQNDQEQKTAEASK